MMNNKDLSPELKEKARALNRPLVGLDALRIRRAGGSMTRPQAGGARA